MKKIRQPGWICGILLASLASLNAAISVGPTGTGVQIFDGQPGATEWSTLALAGAPADFTDAAQLDDAVKTTSALDIATGLGSSATLPPSVNNLTRRNTAGQYLQTRPNNATPYVVLMATLQNNTGATANFLTVSYDFNIALAVGSTPVEEIPGLRAFYSQTGEPGSWLPIAQFTTATPGKLQSTLSVPNWTDGSLVYLLWADDDANAHNTAPNEEAAYTIDNFQAVVSAVKEPAFRGFTSSALGFSAQLDDGVAPQNINLATVTATLNGNPIEVQATKTGDIVTLAHSGFLPSNSTNTLVINFSDNANPIKNYSITQNLIIAPYAVIPEEYAVSGVDTSVSGFKAFIHQIAAARAPGDRNSIANAEKQLANGFIDPNTNAPYPNDALTPGTPDGFYHINPTAEAPIAVINWNQDIPPDPAAAGSFSDASAPPRPDSPIPGIPGINGSTDDIVGEIFTYLELKAGVAYTMGVNSDDGFKVTVGPNPRDAFSLVLGSFNTGRGVADTLFNFVVEKDGIYPFRLLWWEGTGGAALEWFSVAPNGQKILINDREITGAIKAYDYTTALPPYVRLVSPAQGDFNAPGDLALLLEIVDASTAVVPNTVKLFVNDQLVSATVDKVEGSPITTVAFDPPGTLPPEANLAVRLVYGDDANPSVLRTNEYTIRVKALVLVGVDDTTLWSYERSGVSLGTEWREKVFNDSQWLQGPALLGVESDVTVEPLRTPFPGINNDIDGTFIITHYFRHKFNFTGNPAAVNLQLRHVIDDGAVFYLNGEEIHRFGFADGATIEYGSFASSNEQAWRGPFPVSKASLVNGENVLAVEVHQTSSGSSDIVFGAELQAYVDPTVGPASIESISPVPGSTNQLPSVPIEIVLLDGSTLVAPGTIKLTINGQVVTPVITKAPGSISTKVSYLPNGGFTPESTVNVKFEFDDNTFPANKIVREYSFTIKPLTLFTVDAVTLWKYDRSGTDLGTAWREPGYDDSTWPEGAALLGVEPDAKPEPLRTPFPSINNDIDGTFIITHYFRHKFNFTGNPAAVRLQLLHVLDDGAVFYLNGFEIHRFGIAADVAVNFDTFFTSNENAWRGPFDVTRAPLLQGENVLAVEVHQTSNGSSDIVFGAELLALVDTTAGLPRVVSITPSESSDNQAPIPTIEFILEDGLTQVAQNSIKLSVNGQVVTPVIAKPAGGILTRVTYTPTTAFGPEEAVALKLEFTDNANPAASIVSDTTFQIAPTFQVLFGIDGVKTWKYLNTGDDLGTAWKEKNFDDSAWPEGPALFAAEDGATVEVISTPLSRIGGDGVTNIITDYFRTHFNFTGDPTKTRLRIRHVVDDGAIVYLNGQEVHRFYFAPDAVIANNTLAGVGFTPTDHENRYEGPFFIPTDALVVGDNVLAVELHQNSTTSSDSVFGLELQLVTSDPPTPTESRFTVVAKTDTGIRIEWTGPGALEEATNILGPWNPVANATSPFTTNTSEPVKFYRLKR